jgi:hypothetical protein
MWLYKINFKEDTVRFRLVYALLKINSTTSSITVLCCAKIGYPRWVTDCYLYRLKNHLINMTNFQCCYNPSKHVPNLDSWLRLCPTSWAVAAIGPLTRVIFVISSLAPKHVIKSVNFSFQSGYRPIGKHWSDALVEPDFMRWDPLIGFMLSSVLTALTFFFRCCSGLMIWSTHVDESVTRVKNCAAATSLCTFSRQLDNLLNRMDNRRMMHGPRSIAIDC